MRITGGRAKGIQLIVPTETSSLRSTADYIRESVFSSIKGKSHNALFLDLFAGIGSYGLEAISRGASTGIFVEQDKESAKAIEENIKLVKKSAQREPSCKVFCQNVFDIPAQLNSEFDLIFIDPPYSMVDEFGEQILSTFGHFLKKGDNARLMFEVPARYKAPPIHGLVEIRRLGRIASANHPNVIIYTRVQ